ncbi:MAG: Allophanate hydrolase [Frankiales bacterium]|nr:Allophanate hydrolase [Frankiales bacterium]
MRAVRPYGPVAFLLECLPDEAVSLHSALLAGDLYFPGLVQTVPGAESLLVECSSISTAREAARLLAVVSVPPVSREVRSHVVRVVYDGLDLASVASAHALSTDEVVDLHTSSVCTVALTGFAPGFAYLRGLDPRLATPRLSSPRPSVPAGSVAIGGTWTGVYPRSGPGGWNILGTTAFPLWDLDRECPAALQLGDRVQFRSV